MVKTTHSVLIAAAIVVAVVAGCATGRAEMAPAIYAEDTFGAIAAPSEAPAATDAARSSATGGKAVSAEDGSTASSPAERLRVYSADLTLSVVRIENARDRVMTLAESRGGYVESSAGEYVTIRIPAEHFESALAEIEKMGTVVHRSISTTDVTEQFADLERRLGIAQRSRDRLYELLEQAEEAEERVAILREIRRLTEEIEALEASKSSLEQMIRYSRITVRLQSRLAGPTVDARRRIPFDWISNLDPLRQTTGRAKRPLSIEIGPQFAVLHTGRTFIAESADGIRIRVGGVENEPLGDTTFWTEALLHHLAPLYPVSEELDAGPFGGVLLLRGAPESYVYIVLAAVRESEIIVAEAFVPDGDPDDESVSAILEAFERVEL